MVMMGGRVMGDFCHGDDGNVHRRRSGIKVFFSSCGPWFLADFRNAQMDARRVFLCLFAFARFIMSSLFSEMFLILTIFTMPL